MLLPIKPKKKKKKKNFSDGDGKKEKEINHTHTHIVTFDENIVSIDSHAHTKYIR